MPNSAPLPPPAATVGPPPASHSGSRRSGVFHPGLLVVLLLFLVLNGLAFYIAEREHERVLARTQEHLNHATQQALRHTEENFNIFERTLSGIGEVVRLYGHVGQGDDLFLHRLLLRRQMITAGVSWISLINPQGLLTVRTTHFPMPVFDVSDREFFQVASLADEQLFIGKPLVSRLEAERVSPVSLPIRGDGHQLIGVVNAFIKPEVFAQILRAQPLPAGARLYLLHQDGFALACLEDSPARDDCLTRDWRPTPLFKPPYSDLPGGNFASARLLSQGNGPAAFARSTSYPLLVAGEIDMRVITQLWQAERQHHMLLLALGNLTLLLVTWFAWLQWRRRQEVLLTLRHNNAALETTVAERTAALQASNQELQAIFDTAAVGILYLENRFIRRCNPQLERMLGYEPGELLGQSVATLYPNHEDFERVGASLYPQLQDAEIFAMSQQLRRKDGSRVWAQLLGRPLHGTQPESTLLGVVQDISQERQATLALQRAKLLAEQASQAKSDFLANMSHEIRTPLNAILGFSDLLLQLELERGVTEQVRHIHDAATALLRIVNDILDYSRIEAGQITLEIQPFALQASLTRMSDWFRLAREARQLDWQVDVAADVPPWLRGDALRLEQVLINLLGNAIKFTAQGGITLQVRCLSRETQACTLEFRICDTGIGLHADDAPRLFEPFTQADSSITRKYGGTGLGLSICKRLVTRMGGEIGVTSQPGAGSCFHFTARFGLPGDMEQLPASDSDSASPPPGPAGAPPMLEERPTPAATPLPTPTPTQLPPASLIALLEVLHEQLASQQFTAQKTAQDIAALLHGGSHAAAFAPIATAATQLQFRQAMLQLETLLNALQTPPKEGS